MARHEIKIGGFGGQGVILTGIIAGKAAAIFEQCGGALRGDAYAEAAAAWAAAGTSGRAQAAAKRYLQAYPDGVHAERMRALAGGG